MRNPGKTPKSAVIERMGSDSQIAHQISGLVEGNFRNILARAKIVRLFIWLFSRVREKNIAGAAVFFTSGRENEESLVLLFGVELAFSLPSLLTLMVRHNIRASWLGLGYV